MAIVSIVFLLGHNFPGNFEEKSRKLSKYLITLLIIPNSTFAGRAYAFHIRGLAFIPVWYVHGILLPKKGING